MGAQDWVDRIHPHPWMIAARKVYKGVLETKWEALARYDFCLCFENVRVKGWLTEKLFRLSTHRHNPNLLGGYGYSRN